MQILICESLMMMGLAFFCVYIFIEVKFINTDVFVCIK